MAAVVDDPIHANAYDDGEGVLTMPRGQDMRDVLVDEAALGLGGRCEGGCKQSRRWAASHLVRLWRPR
jgi:hypothetical protein